MDITVRKTVDKVAQSFYSARGYLRLKEMMYRKRVTVR